MTPIEFANKHSFEILNEGEGNERPINGVYCCDLLSIVMGRAKLDDAWITVMSNVNSIAVAVLADVSCIILSEGMALDDQATQKAVEQNVCVLKSNLPTYEIALLLKDIL
ncbi:DRTGG domain-containing protein [Paludicola sp. MB14-C6]|uniref:DRTGG domain-containing protein n=1 Tax=Paludihabitans sp. MB14-C6 TaxID=3070656 RepID=UPI0027DC101E|nr:DRTGG domain-containing protein [Paludicola sp. MB14-C6]WMJ23424.1 DRTGG domain-containing protein [Paludicola sp. MB14-C6]